MNCTSRAWSIVTSPAAGAILYYSVDGRPLYDGLCALRSDAYVERRAEPTSISRSASGATRPLVIETTPCRR
jgi:hypothetical protein